MFTNDSIQCFCRLVTVIWLSPTQGMFYHHKTVKASCHLRSVLKKLATVIQLIQTFQYSADCASTRNLLKQFMHIASTSLGLLVMSTSPPPYPFAKVKDMLDIMDGSVYDRLSLEPPAHEQCGYIHTRISSHIQEVFTAHIISYALPDVLQFQFTNIRQTLRVKLIFSPSGMTLAY